MIVQGDNGTVLKINISEMHELNGVSYLIESLVLNEQIENIIVKIKTNTRSILKNATVVDGSVCEVYLTTDDLSESGTYKIQLTVEYVDGNKFSTEIATFNVGEKI
jgi:hypothetical protein